MMNTLKRLKGRSSRSRCVRLGLRLRACGTPIGCHFRLRDMLVSGVLCFSSL